MFVVHDMSSSNIEFCGSSKM